MFKAKQLDITANTLLGLGFKQSVTVINNDITLDINSTVIYKIQTINGYFYFNPTEKEYCWYHKTILGDVCNYVNLNIETMDELLTVLKVFNVKGEQ